MANYEELKKKAKDALETIADVSAEAYKIAEEKAKVLAKKAKLNAEITREKALIRRLNSNIGSKYYELHKDDPEIAFKDECESITDSLARIGAKKRELEDLKSGGTCCEDAEDCCCDGDVAAEECCDGAKEDCCTPEAKEENYNPAENNEPEAQF